MKPIAIIFIAVISISSVIPFTGDAAKYNCPSDYERDFICRKLEAGDLVCPTGNGSTDGDPCFVDNKNCSLDGRLDRTEHICEDGFTFNRSSNVCVKLVYHGAPGKYCPFPEYVEKNGVCKFLSKKTEICPEDSDSPPLCKKRSYKKRSSSDECEMHFQVDSTDDQLCKFKEGAPTSFCSGGTELHEETNMCIDPPDMRGQEMSFGCRRGKKSEGKCMEEVKKPARYLCPLEPGMVQSNEVAFNRPFRCFEGTLNGGKCEITTNVHPIVRCPSGYSVSSGTTMCKSDDFILPTTS